MRMEGRGAVPQPARAAPTLSRRRLLQAGVLGGALLAIDACAPRTGSTRYGLLGPPDANGLQLPPGFRSRVVARSGELVAATGYQWHPAPDGGYCFAAPGGWVYVSNSEVLDRVGGVGMVRFGQDGTVIVRPASSLTPRGTAPAGTPLGHVAVVRGGASNGRVFEVDPLGREAAGGSGGWVASSTRGPRWSARRVVYLTEDEPDGRFYRCRFDRRPSHHWCARGGTGRRGRGVLARGARPAGRGRAHPLPGAGLHRLRRR